eukprot:3578943-Prymnesium_polylepis.1
MIIAVSDSDRSWSHAPPSPSQKVASLRSASAAIKGAGKASSSVGEHSSQWVSTEDREAIDGDQTTCSPSSATSRTLLPSILALRFRA